MADRIAMQDRTLVQPDLAGFRRPMAPRRATPFMELDGERLDRNLTSMQALATAGGVRLRPHIKTHKSIAIARRQIELGAIGLTASKPSEALVFVEAGFKSVTLAFPVIEPSAIDDLLVSAKRNGANVEFIAGSGAGVDVLSTAARRHGIRLPVYLKVDVGLGRVGVKPGDPEAVRLAQRISEDGNLRFAGLLSHAGHAYAASDQDAIKTVAKREAEDLQALSKRLHGTGIAVPLLSVGATPTVLGAPLPPGIGEIRPGNYALMDLTALRLGLCSPDDLALTVVSRIVAVNDAYAIVDAGSKALSSDQGPHSTGGMGYGLAVALEGDAVDEAFHVEKLSEEHGFLRIGNIAPKIGDLVRIFPKHSCAVVAQHNDYVLRHPDGRDETVAVDARGRFS